VVAREAGSWKWAIGQFVFMSAFAAVAALIVFQVGTLLFS
jgi:ferrous iron transport protein B